MKEENQTGQADVRNKESLLEEVIKVLTKKRRFTFLRRYWYRPLMKFSHKNNWHHLESNYNLERNKVHLWCTWCGVRDVQTIMHGKYRHVCDENCITHKI